MNRMGYSERCRVCGTDMRGNRVLAAVRLNAIPRGTIHQPDREREALTLADLARQMSCGICDSCQRLRQAAALDYMRAADEVRILDSLGVRWAVLSGVRPQIHSPFARMLDRVKDAERRCVELKMWPDSWTTKRPPLFYGDERSNTE